MAVVQFTRTLGDAGPIAATPLPSAPSAANAIFAAVWYFDGTQGTNGVNTPAGWELVSYGNAYTQHNGLLFRRLNSTAQGFDATYSSATAARWAVVLWEDDEGTGALRAAACAPETETPGHESPTITCEVGDYLVGWRGKNAFAGTYATSAGDWTDIANAPADDRGACFAHHGTADATSEASAVTWAVGGDTGWAIAGIAAFEPANAAPAVVEVSGEGGFDFTGTASLVSAAPGTWALDTSSIGGVAPPVGGFLRLIGTTSSQACWVEVTAIDGDTLYIVDAQQAGDDTLASLASAEAAGSIEIRRHS